MKGSRGVLGSLVLVGLMGSGSGGAQTPLGPELRVNDQSKNPQAYQVVETSSAGDFFVAWQGITADGKYDGLWGQWYSPEGQPLGHNRAVQLSRSDLFLPALGPGPKGGISIFWSRYLRNIGENTIRTGELGRDGNWLSPPRNLTTLATAAPRFVRPLPQGGSVIALIGSRRNRNEARTFLILTDAEGRRLYGPDPVYPARRSSQYVDGLAMSPSGKFLVTWTDDGARARVLAQIFSPNGRSLGVPVQVHDNVRGAQFVGRSAALGSHGYVVVWNDEDYETGRANLKMRFLDPEGKRRGPVLRVNEDDRHTRLGGQIAADKDGNFFVVWQEGGPPGTFGRGWDVWGRLFRPDGTPVGPKQVLNRYTLDDQTEPYAVASANGTFIVVWQSYGQDGDAEGIFGQIVAASPADEACALGTAGLRCDLARSGGKAELEMALASGGEAAFGDWDGDGRADPCRFDAGSWSCDLDHFGAPDEASLSFGQAGDRPLLGDLDGDGHADPCVQRGAQLLCDMARDGGQPERTLDLGQPADTLAMADVDGDGRAEACAVRGASFLCDTGHDGGAFEWERRFGSGTGLAVFGDADGDGKDEPCVLEGAELLCDSAQAEVRLNFPVQPGERLMLVNLDGL